MIAALAVRVARSRKELAMQMTQERPRSRERTPGVLVRPVATARGEVVGDPPGGQRRDSESKATDQTECS